MTDKEVYMKWAPFGKKWVDWVRPVPFIGIRDFSERYSFRVPILKFLDINITKTAIVVDLTGVKSVETGIALAQAGFRPIPIYNGTIEQEGARATVDNSAVGTALIWGASELDKIEIKNDAPPAFLLDSNRMNRYKMNESIFDNSWDVYHQDMPSAEYFMQNEVDRIIIVSEKVSKDLKKILYGYQEKGIRISWTQGYEIPQEIVVSRQFVQDDF